MGLTVADHLVVASFSLVFPLYSLLTYPRIKRALVANLPGARLREYRETLSWLWGLGVLGLVVWIYLGRPVRGLGFETPGGWRFWLCLALVLVFISFLMNQYRWVRRDERARHEAVRQLSAVQEYLPRTSAEFGHFVALSLSAGVWEELLYRGYLIRYLSSMFGIVVAIVASSVVFGFAHLAHGASAAIRAGVLGLVFAGLFLFSGSLWLPIVLHAFIDVYAGLTARTIYVSS